MPSSWASSANILPASTSRSNPGPSPSSTGASITPRLMRRCGRRAWLMESSSRMMASDMRKGDDSGERRKRWVSVAILALVCVWMAAYSYPYFFKGLSHTEREIATYNIDAVAVLDSIKFSMTAPWHQFSYIEYGHFYFNLSMAGAEIYRLFMPLTEQSLYAILRLFALLGSLATIATTFVF